jgi:hypothetical protein
MNKTPIKWFAKWQNTIETSMFGAKFVALKIAAETNESIHYHLCTMMGIRIDGETNVFADNKSVVDNGPYSKINIEHETQQYCLS